MRQGALGLVLVCALGGSALGCSLVTDFDGYVGRSSGGPGAGFGSFHFARGAASFVVPASEGLLAASGAEQRVIAGSLSTAKGGSLELDRSGSFVYVPPGAPGSFWGDDYFEYAFDDSPEARARVRLTVQPSALRLTELADNPSAAFGIAGAVAEDALSTTVISAAGDVNGDGFEDYVLGAMGPKTYLEGGAAPIGPGRAAYVVFGKGDTASVSLAALEGTPAKGFAILGDEDEFSLDAFGFRVARAGDVNGDGLDDVIVGSFAYDPAFVAGDMFVDFVGAAYVVFGKADSAPVKSVEIRNGQGGGFAILSRDNRHRYVGLDVRGAGDVNGDGLDDVIVSSPVLNAEDPLAASGAHVVFGKASPAPVLLEDVASGQSGGFALLAGADEPFAGFLVSGVGDVNGDALDDVAAFSLYFVEPAGARGRVAVVFGKRDREPVQLASLADNPAIGFSILGAEGVLRDWKIAAGGDVNGDGLDDILTSIPLGSLGSARPEPLREPVDSPDAGAVADVVDAGEAGDAADAGDTVDAGDMAGGGSETPVEVVDDSPELGVTYVVFGKREPGDISLRALEEGAATGLAITGNERSQRLGNGLSAGDVNGDGLSDVLVSAALGEGLGKAYVVFGKQGSGGLVTLAEGQVGLDVGLEVFPDGPQGGGFAISGADANADGIDDILLSAPLYADAPQLAGGAYVALGWDMTGALTGRDRALIGSSGDDFFDLPADDVVIVRGGNGTDTLRVGSRTLPLDLRVPGRYQSIEVVDLRGGGPQLLSLDEAALRRVPDNLAGFAFGLARRLTVLGDAEDTLELDLADFSVYGANAGRLVYGRSGVYYGLEVSQELHVSSP